MSDLHFIDTNVLLYSISRNPKEEKKRECAVQLLDQDDGVLSVQVLQEFYVQATRASRPDAITHEIAAGLISKWVRFKVQDVTASVLFGALEIRSHYGYSYWDSAIIAAARAAGCGILYSEDMQHGRELQGIRIVNPFLKL